LTRIGNDLVALPKVLREVLAAVWANVASGLHGYLGWIDAQNSPLTCELERLADWAALYGVDRLLATAATGNVLATGNLGAQIPAGTILRGANGLDYTVLAAVVLGAGNTVVTVRCASNGLAGNLAVGAVLALVDPLVGVTANLTVDAQALSGGADDELVNDWRLRVVAEWQAVVTTGARGGKIDDYRYWARSAHVSVSGAIVQPHALGIGTVVVRPFCNLLANRLPSQAVLDAVSARLTAIAPAVADWRVAAPVVYAVSLTIHLLPAVDTAPNRAAIFAALNEMVLTKGGDDVLTLLWSEIDTTIALTTTQYTINEVGAITWLATEVPVLQAINWI
jgi:uncharacterized phage protein gp47/JayE